MRTVIDLLRHGEPVGGRRYRGQQDDPLSDTGWAQMRTSCAEQSWDAVVSSPLQRCARFAEELVAGAETPLVVDPFAGGGSIPLETLRLGCEAFASDLDPVAGLILNQPRTVTTPMHGTVIGHSPQTLRCHRALIGMDWRRRA